MDLKNLFSLILFCFFFTAYILKLIILYRQNGINANVLAKGNKDKETFHVELSVKIVTFIWGLSWIMLSFFEKAISGYVITLITSTILGYAGLTFMSLGLIIFITAMVSMKASWRVGIDKQTRTELISAGIYKISRNPAFVGFRFMFAGLFITYPSLLTLAIGILNFAAIHRLILQEEKHLESVFGDSYLKYKSRAPRYILF